MVQPRPQGYRGPMFGRWKNKGEKHRANKQQGDPAVLERAGDPRGGLQDEQYRSAGPTDVVAADGRIVKLLSTRADPGAARGLAGNPGRPPCADRGADRFRQDARRLSRRD